jgi:hypothetical protein
MMTCKEYVFKLTSGQLEEADRLERFWALQHRLMCRHCRAFTRNNQRLDGILAAYQDQLTRFEGEQPRPD